MLPLWPEHTIETKGHQATRTERLGPKNGASSYWRHFLDTRCLWVAGDLSLVLSSQEILGKDLGPDRFKRQLTSGPER